MAFELFSPRLELAPYAAQPSHSKGRLVEERASSTRNAFQRDRDRILHSTAFRRLKHKTQVFVYHEGDHYRTRLTHSLEVAQIARSMARALGLSEDLAEAIALSHDLGHPPFGHAGEAALDSCMSEYGGFDHNAQALRLVTKLEQKYARFDGLNLTWDTLEGLVKHNGPIDLAQAPQPIRKYNAEHDLQLSTHASLEAQIAAIADDIAYNAHDIDDGLRAQMFDINDLDDVPILKQIIEGLRAEYGHLPPFRLAHEALRQVITYFVDDALATTRQNLLELAPGSAADVRECGHALVALSPQVAEEERQLKSFLFTRMYRHGRVRRMTSQAQRIITGLFETFFDRPAGMPADWAAIAEGDDKLACARAVSDYVAGMTDRYAIGEYHRHIGALALET